MDDHIGAWLAEKWGADRACSFCGHADWGYDSEPVMLPRVGYANVTGPAVYLVHCMECGAGVPINAAMVDVYGAETLITPSPDLLPAPSYSPETVDSPSVRDFLVGSPPRPWHVAERPPVVDDLRNKAELERAEPRKRHR